MQKDFLLYYKSWQKLKDEKNCEVEEAEKSITKMCEILTEKTKKDV